MTHGHHWANGHLRSPPSSEGCPLCDAHPLASHPHFSANLIAEEMTQLHLKPDTPQKRLRKQRRVREQEKQRLNKIRKGRPH